ncbi:hypothetical protein J2848_001175 [Azospirillum lipoferum]|uniref:Uncharacterized protein n=1 Tax=Azospirillum lipoferum TaxID=193 RepID=A0A5A9GXQ9_AZOLI|nr:MULTISPECIES: hypothetical protein [Azospirillum]KAA0598475.1 hypothetical protein FZ942_05185 [Azospirillum lipoferum]MCP1609528.1 hypothetical protein [Azospirillum lipoferum]MDW5535163.1 hypothetical protein [Azospirillum sp. NL1]
MRFSSRISRTVTAAALTLVAAAPALAQSLPNYGGTGVTQCIPFANFQSVSFTDPPKLNFSIAGDSTIHTVTMDTGSVGVAISASNIPNYETLKTAPGAKPGTQFLSSSKVLWVGTWVPMTVTLYDRASKPVATSEVFILGVEKSGTCDSYQTDQQICPGLPAPAKPVLYMGVGFGQEADFQPQGTPDKNVLLNLRSVNGQPIANGSLNAGYIIGRQGIQVGLTADNTAGFRFAKLEAYAQYPGDWMMPRGCITVNPELNRDASGPICTPANILVDTGIPQSYLTLPPAIRFDTVQQPDASEPNKSVGVLAPRTSVAVNIPDAANPIAVDAFIVGAGAPNEPQQVIPWSTDKRPPFINTGRHFLRQYQFLYDAKQGYVGMKDQPNGCGEQ